MNTQAIEIFLDIYRLGSLKKVAELHRTSSSTISRELTRLEEDLGTRLFQRTTRTIKATEEGDLFFLRAQPLLQELQKLKEDLVDPHKNEPSGTLRITSPVSFGLMHLVPLVGKFQTLFQQIEINTLLSDSRLDLISERIDVAIRFGRLADSNLIGKKLLRLEYKLYVSTRYLERNSIPIIPEELQDHQCLNFLLPNIGDIWKFRQENQPKTIEVKIPCRTHFSNALAIKEATKAGMGISMLPSILMTDLAENNDIITVLDEYEMTPTHFDSFLWMMYPSRSFMPKRTSEFLRFLEKEIKNIALLL